MWKRMPCPLCLGPDWVSVTYAVQALRPQVPCPCSAQPLLVTLFLPSGRTARKMDGTYCVLPTPASRLGTRTPAGVSSLEPGQTLGTQPVAPPRDKCLTVHVRLLDDSMEMLDVEVRPRAGFRCAHAHRSPAMSSVFPGVGKVPQGPPALWVHVQHAQPQSVGTGPPTVHTAHVIQENMVKEVQVDTGKEAQWPWWGQWSC